MNRWAALALLLAVAGALALRLPQLGARPLHNDEGVNAVKVAALWERGDFKYDPHEFHGPSLYYFSLPYLWLSPTKNATELDATRLRFVTIAFGVGLILLLPLLADGLGKTAIAMAAVFIAASPAMVFYSRYYIHEMLLVFFTLLTVAAGWRYVRTRKILWAVLTGVGVGLMFATKETFVLSLAAMFGAGVLTTLWNRWRVVRTSPSPTEGAETQRQRVLPPWSHVALGVAAVGVVWLVLFSSFFTNWQGLADSALTYVPWLKRAGGHSPHINPWYFYFERLAWFQRPKGPVWSELFIIGLALVGGAGAIFSNRRLEAVPTLARFIAFYTLLLAGIYSVISYKTPWCLLNFWVGAILLAGWGAAMLGTIFQKRLVKVVVLVGLAIGVGQLAGQARLAAGQTLLKEENLTADRRNPYTYSQTPEKFLDLLKRIEIVAAAAPTGRETVMKIILPESNGPLPWYLREFKNTGWWEAMPEDPLAPIVIVDAKMKSQLDERPGSTLVMTGMYEMHPGSFVELYVDRELWAKCLPQLPRDAE